MIFDLIATISAGGFVAGIVMALRWLSRGRLPRWLVPAGIGAGMLAFGIWSEYSWFGRTLGGLPDTVAVLSAPAETSPLRPWTYLAPVTSRFLAIDRAAVLRGATDPALRRADVLVVARWVPVRRVGMVFDCATGRQAEADTGTAAGDLRADAAWRAAPPEDPAQAAACGDG